MGYGYTILLDMYILVSGSWALISHVCVYTGISFFRLTVTYSVVLSILLTTYIIAVRKKALSLNYLYESGNSAEKEPPVDTGPPKRVWLGVSLLSVILLSSLGYPLTEYYIPWILVSLVFLAVIIPRLQSRMQGEDRSSHANHPTIKDTISLILLILFAVIIYGLLRRYDIDDSYFVNISVYAKHAVNKPVYGFDSLSGMIGGLEKIQIIHRPQTFEIFAAYISYLSGISVHSVYYIMLPIINIAFTLTIYFLVFSRLFSRNAMIYVFFLLLVLFFWGGTHRAYGNFAFIRMFQGKAVFITLLVPFIFYAFTVFHACPSKASYLRLVLLLIGATAFTSTSLIVLLLIVSILTLAMALLEGSLIQRKVWSIAVPGIYVLALLLVIQYELYTGDIAFSSIVNLSKGILPYFIVMLFLVFIGLLFKLMSDTGGFLVPTSKNEKQILQYSTPLLFFFMYVVLGTFLGLLFHYQNEYLLLDTTYSLETMTGERLGFALLLFLTMPVLSIYSRQKTVTVFGVISVVYVIIMLNPFVNYAIASFVAENMAWRSFWAVPFPLICVAAIGILIEYIPVFKKKYRWTAGVTIITAFLLYSGNTFYNNNHMLPHKWFAYKVHEKAFDIAKSVHEMNPEGSILAPNPVNYYLSHFPGKLRQNNLRAYLYDYSAFLPEGIKRRMLLDNFINAQLSYRTNRKSILETIRARRLDYILVDTKMLNSNDIITDLGKMYKKKVKFEGYLLLCGRRW